MELTILMPCLNEAETIERCIAKARNFLETHRVAGEVLVADNGSADGSIELAVAAGARVVSVENKGYGEALKSGIEAAKSRFVIMGDADDSYDFSAVGGILEQLRAGAQLVMGNRFEGGIQAGAMPFLHRYLGNPVLSFIGRLFYRVPVRDFHCGMRGFDRSAVQGLGLTMSGMEFASEMVVKSALHNLRIAEVPVTLAPDGRSRPPHLRTWRDGWRHLRFLLLFSPRWLFLWPGLLLLLLGILGFATVGSRAVAVGRFGLDIHTLAYAGAAVLMGFQMLLFAFMTKLIGCRGGWLPPDKRVDRFMIMATLERLLGVSVLFFFVGGILTYHAVATWAQHEFGALDPSVTMRWVVPAVTSIALGGELFLAACFIEALRLPNRNSQ